MPSSSHLDTIPELALLASMDRSHQELATLLHEGLAQDLVALTLQVAHALDSDAEEEARLVAHDTVHRDGQKYREQPSSSPDGGRRLEPA